MKSGDDDDDFGDDDEGEEERKKGKEGKAKGSNSSSSATTSTKEPPPTSNPGGIITKSKKTSDLEPITLQSLTGDLSFGAGAEADDLTPTKVVKLLDDYIVGQNAAKRAVAVAVRNRWRRHRGPEDLRD